MKRNQVVGSFVFCFFLVIIFWGAVRAEENTVQEFSYRQKRLSQVKEKNLNYKVAIGWFDERVNIAGSPFNKAAEKASGAEHTYNVNIASPNLEKPPEDKINVVTGLLSDLLKQTNMFDVIERQEVNQLIREIQFEKSDWAKKEEGNALGNFYGIQYVLLGDILPSRAGEWFGSGQYTATLRLVDVNTGLVISTGTGQGNYLKDALAEAVGTLTHSMEGEPWTCRIVRVDEKGIYINAGIADRIQKNDVFVVMRLVEPIKDGNRILGYRRSEIAKIKITDVLEKNLSLAKPFDVKEEVKVGDCTFAKRIKSLQDTEMNKWNKVFERDSSKENNAASPR